MRIVVACFGNVLRADDGIGVAVANELVAAPVPDDVEVLEVGIGGIHLVQRLLDPVDALVVVDAVDVGREPGTVVVIRPDVRDLAGLSPAERGDELYDMHYATPERAFLLARALGVLPEDTLLVGCQVSVADGLGDSLPAELEAAVDVTAAEVRRVVSELGVPWE